ncbi:MAG TPA: anti-sigma factor antagonist [Planctomycetaceae bacterium]|nr:anti-sigma factor antagonist [Planctomycetaceae bacterium]
MESTEAPYGLDRCETHFVLTLNPLINDGQWANVSQVGTEIIERLESSRVPKLLVDLSPLEYMGSAQVALLVRVWKSLKKVNGRMAVHCPHEMVREVLAIAGLKALWEISPTNEGALQSLGVPVRKRTSGGIAGPSFAVAGLLGAAIALVLTVSTNPPPASGQMCELAVAAAALLVGCITAYWQTRVWRGVGLATLAISVAMFSVVGVRWAKDRGEKPHAAVEAPASAPDATDSAQASR